MNSMFVSKKKYNQLYDENCNLKEECKYLTEIHNQLVKDFNSLQEKLEESNKNKPVKYMR